jgi:hypothetical protein
MNMPAMDATVMPLHQMITHNISDFLSSFNVDCTLDICDDDKFSCDDGKLCINKQWLCDGHADCKDRSDEAANLCGMLIQPLNVGGDEQATNLNLYHTCY